MEGESSLNGIDPDFRELARLSYQIPGFASYGVSCSGHFYPEDEWGRFHPGPWGHMGFVALPEVEHIPGLLKLLYDLAQKDADAKIRVDDSKPPLECPVFSPGMNLEPYTLWKTAGGLYVAKLDLRLGDNSSLDSVQDHLCCPIKREGNDEAFEKSKARCSEIQRFWKGLELAVGDYCRGNGFLEADFDKREFNSQV